MAEVPGTLASTHPQGGLGDGSCFSPVPVWWPQPCVHSLQGGCLADRGSFGSHLPHLGSLQLSTRWPLGRANGHSRERPISPAETEQREEWSPASAGGPLWNPHCPAA